MKWNFLVGKGRKPWKHQIECFEWAHKRAQAAFFLEMGLGKTAIVANLLEYHRTVTKKIQRGLIVSPVAVSDAWVEEMSRCFGISVLNLSDFDSTARRTKALESWGGEYVVANVDGLDGLEDVLYGWLYGKGGKDKAAMVVDESTDIKNPRAQRTKAAVRLGFPASLRYILTGTPSPQGPEDIFGQYLFLDSKIFGSSFTTFRASFLQMGGYMNKVIVGLRPSRMKDYNYLIYTCAIRKTKAECLDMPPKVPLLLTYQLSKEERKLYDQFAEDWVAEIGDEQILATNGLTKAMRLGQICTGFAGALRDMERVEVELPGASKMKVLKDFVQKLDGKFIIWCAWKKNVRDVLAMLAELGIKGVDYTGDTKDRRANEMAFREDPKVRAFVGTAASGGAGLNLQGPTCKTVIYYSQGYSVFEREQSEDRAHRGNIKHTVTIVDIVAKKTVEEVIVKALKSGRKMQQVILRNPRDFVSGIYKEEA